MQQINPLLQGKPKDVAKAFASGERVRPSGPQKLTEDGLPLNQGTQAKSEAKAPVEPAKSARPAKEPTIPKPSVPVETKPKAKSESALAQAPVEEPAAPALKGTAAAYPTLLGVSTPLATTTKELVAPVQKPVHFHLQPAQ